MCNNSNNGSYLVPSNDFELFYVPNKCQSIQRHATIASFLLLPCHRVARKKKKEVSFS